MKISLILPTRNRPKNMQNVYDTANNTISEESDFEVIFYIDEDDYVSLEKALSMQEQSMNIRYVKGPRQTLSNCWNEACNESTGDVIGFIDDETRFVTKNWDLVVLSIFDQYEDKICFVGGNDNYYNVRWGKNFCTLGFLHRNWIETVGYFVPPYFVADYCDTWLNDVAKEINRHFWIEDLHIHHLHRETEYGLDSTHRERLERAKTHNPRGLYYSEDMRQKRRIDAFKLNTFIKNFKKEIP